MFEADPKSVFLNVPYDRQYEPLFARLVGTLVFLGQTPRCVLEVRERGQGRLERIYGLLKSCGISIHDLSRAGRAARYNMPFELGLACSLALDGKPHEVLVLDTIPYRLDRTLSDYKGRDPLLYHGRVDGLVDCLADVFQTIPGPPADAFSELLLINGDDQRDIGHRIFFEAGRFRGQPDIPHGVGPFEDARQGYAHHGCDSAAIQGITLNDDDGSPKPWAGSDQLPQIGPPDLSLADYHSTRSRTRRAARRLKASASPPTSSITRFIASVRRSGECRASNSCSARL